MWQPRTSIKPSVRVFFIVNQHGGTEEIHVIGLVKTELPGNRIVKISQPGGFIFSPVKQPRGRHENLAFNRQGRI